MIPRQRIDDRPYATTAGFYVGDRVEVHLPKGEDPCKGYIVGIVNKQAIVQLDHGAGTWRVGDDDMVRIED